MLYLRRFKEAPAWRCLPTFEARLRELLALPVNVDEAGALAPPVLTMTDGARATWVRFHDGVEAELRPGGEMAEVRDVASKAADKRVADGGAVSLVRPRPDRLHRRSRHRRSGADRRGGITRESAENPAREPAPCHVMMAAHWRIEHGQGDHFG